MKIYVASSWRNTLQQGVVHTLRAAGHEVYDFKNPPTRSGFGWKQIDGGWEGWTTAQYLEALKHPLALEGYKSDKDALDWADACVLVMPCGRSAHLEMGYAMGAKKKTVILLMERAEPELMYKLADHIVTNFGELLTVFGVANAAE